MSDESKWDVLPIDECPDRLDCSLCRLREVSPQKDRLLELFNENF